MARIYRYRSPGGRYYYEYYAGPYYGTVTRTDEEIEADIETDLILDTWVDSDQVNVDVDAGIVTLTGTVDSLVEKRSAGDDAWDTLGVIDVNNNLTISP